MSLRAPSLPVQTRMLISRTDVDRISAIYASGLARFSTSSLLNVFAAQFQDIVRNNRCGAWEE